jgi:SpoVK/Ycf46/Vps4 family AAA+-type ATPase
LVEINSHSLFSKWFSESGKLVQKLFARVNEMVEDESGFVVVLIGESRRR